MFKIIFLIARFWQASTLLQYEQKRQKKLRWTEIVDHTFNNNISTTRRKRRVTNTSGIATDKSTIDKEKLHIKL